MEGGMYAVDMSSFGFVAIILRFSHINEVINIDNNDF
jgi:hypothetical protein